MVAADQYGALDIGRVVQRTFQVLGRNAVPFLGLAVLLVGLPAVIIDVLKYGQTTTLSASSFSPARLVGNFALSLLQFFLTVLLQACVVIASVADLKGNRPSIAESLKQTMRFGLPASAIAILAAFGLFFGFVLLFVPGMILATMWAVIIPAAVIEKTGVFGAFKRSRDLTRGNRWRIFALYVVYGVVALILDFALLAVVGFSFRAGAVPAMSIPMIVVGTALGIIFALVGAVGVSSIYFELRAAGEGMDLDDLAAVFA